MVRVIQTVEMAQLDIVRSHANVILVTLAKHVIFHFLAINMIVVNMEIVQ